MPSIADWPRLVKSLGANFSHCNQIATFPRTCVLDVFMLCARALTLLVSPIAIRQSVSWGKRKKAGDSRCYPAEREKKRGRSPCRQAKLVGLTDESLVDTMLAMGTRSRWDKAQSCTGKSRFVSARVAHMRAKVLNKTTEAYHEVYHCPHCGGYHIGSRERRLRVPYRRREREHDDEDTWLDA